MVLICTYLDFSFGTCRTESGYFEFRMPATSERIRMAVGVNTPLLARKLGVGEACPTYPLRGYSLTIYTNHTSEKSRMEKGRSSNLLNMPISVDDMYCSSVGANMARMAGFGELVGYRDKAVDVPSVAPRVMSR